MFALGCNYEGCIKVYYVPRVIASMLILHYVLSIKCRIVLNFLLEL
ncbi:hypothetical protein APHWI1_0017 [Anaplasma phagocytophilum str. ApWI1]|uniref:Uncharacterized protein n=2 Tax=Anaplasma phagocytophilum TaxID=948 RepID=A0A0F3NDE5_ANAPH|nr:hypothetical protein EPHNCH_1628 [Anaplasma phagocytophilum str. NCH-1]KJV60068.1 hypothetical protein APHWEB_1493 [Anaplasma phagocytophilum str. Webster]KJV83390.1 hypothetical protein APHHGE2_0817 [Anaplasma phagocytophilum str. HGE2]KJV84461.1 hypothetical protein APHWI1_0017 [Anaplasma phagocytophilum str. ApWI1]KJV87783.1 hypothetical protein APHNYW_0549 [Anaplasma phagocytophilum str. ApNYW]KJV98936.1 hypothetical protein OTSANNIE_0785 [Anaplasma phagocytophilum str. Annie]